VIAAGILVLLAGGVVTAEPRVYTIDPARSRIGFHATSRLMDADGVFSRFAGEIRLEDDRLETADGRVTVEVASLDTGIPLRDRHLRSDDFFDVARHPRATFAVSAVRREGDRVTVTGELTIRGVSRPLEVVVTATVADRCVRVVGSFTVNRRDFGITYQSRLNPVGDEVRVSFELVAAGG
jgi:polyisoprenoid-binding protein YceI